MMCYHKKKVETNSNKYASFLSFPKYKINAIFFLQLLIRENLKYIY